MYDNVAKWVYVSGPYTKPDPVLNVNNTIRLASRMLDSGIIVPIVPHLTMFWHLVTPREYEVWLSLDLQLIERCDAVFRIYGESSGADRECSRATELGKPIFGDYGRLMDWAIANE